MLPRTVVVATDYFDQFVRDNGLMYVINADVGDEEILSEFVSSRLPETLVERPAGLHPHRFRGRWRFGRARNWRIRITSPSPVSTRPI
ncbi:MAG: hypothetical protein ACLTZY_07805 [Alistipes indistinctus]